ncbi:MAG: hypothetical protein PVI50_05375 [Gammaproteobacteria bacterium]|jgi:hypothetical protein
MSGKTVVLALLALAALLAGLLDPLFGVAGAGAVWFDMVLSLGCAVLVFSWYYLDTEERAYRRTPLLNIMVVAVGVVAIPYYLFRSRGATQGLRASGLFLLALLMWFVLASTGLAIGEILFMDAAAAPAVL